MNALALIQVLAAGMSSCIGNILLKWSRTSLPADARLPDEFLSIGFIGGLAFYGINLVLYAKSLDYMEVSVAYPVLAGTGSAALAVASYYLFGEPFHLHKWVGLGLILAGIIFLTWGD